MPAPDAHQRESLNYFGAAGAGLLGCFTDALTAEARDTVVVIAQPLGHEYIRCHRALRRLAVYLASNGFPVFRFDWHGTGDSSGEFAESRLDRWIDDLGDAVAEAEARARAGSVAVIGLRHGAAIAAMASDIIGAPDLMVLWDPVYDGARGLAPMRADHARHEKERGLAPGSTRLADGSEDIFGFAYTPSLLADLEAVNLLSLRRSPAAKVLVLDQQDPADSGALSEHLSAIGRCEYVHEPRSPIWMAEPHTGLVPREAIERIGAWLIADSGDEADHA